MVNIVITGFMGTGKSTVGRAVAAALRMAFVDMDEEIARREGMAVAEIFERCGETPFRNLESDLARELGNREGLVVATGGGTLLRVENRTALSQNGLIVCLTCSPEEIARRLAGDGTRPLLAVEGKQERISALLASRRAVYESLPVVIDTTGRTVDEVAAEIIRAFEDNRCKLTTSS